MLALKLLPCSSLLPFSSHPLSAFIWWLGRIPGSFSLTTNTAMCRVETANLASVLEGCEAAA